MAILLIFLLAFQIISEFSSSKATKVRDTNATTAYDTLYATHNTVKKVNSSVDSLLSNIDSTLNITKDELKLIINVNDDLEKVRKEINNSVNEFYSIKEQYEKQIQIEKEKIREAKPVLKVAKAKSIIDSTSFQYQIELYNSGIRLADSIYYHSLIVFVDSAFLIQDIGLYKTNTDEANILSLAHIDNTYNSYFLNSESIKLEKIHSYFQVFLLLYYDYTDDLTDETITNFNIYATRSLEAGNKQFGSNVKDYEKESIKRFLMNRHRKFYDIFYK